MSFLEKAKQAASQAQRAAAERLGDPELQSEIKRQAGAAAGQARKGMVTLVEKIDPGILADIVIKATALQERTNNALRDKRSAYRIGELTITATIPPQLGFAIVRISDDELEELRASTVESSDLVEATETAEAEIVSLDGAVGAPSPAGPGAIEIVNEGSS